MIPIRLSVFPASLMLLLMNGCGDKAPDGNEPRPRVVVESATVKRGNIAKKISVQGTTQALRAEKIRATMSGTVVRVYVLEGDAVRKGQRLLSMRSKEAEASIRGAQELMARATTPAQQDEARTALELAQKSAIDISVVTPFDGIVAARLVNPGEYVTDGTDLLEIVDPASIYFAADVPLAMLNEIRPGDSAELSFPSLSSSSISGTVTAFNPQADPQSQYLKARIMLNKTSEGVKVGAFATATIMVSQHRNVLLVPRQTIYHNDELDRYFVARIIADSLAVQQRVDVGLMDSTNAEILAGLAERDKVISVGGYGLPDSTLVKVR